MSNPIGIDLTAIDTTAEFRLGSVFTHETSAGTKKYKYVQYDAATAATAGVAGEAVYYVKPATSVTGTVVTSDVSDSDGVGAGILQSSLTDNAYGWIQVQGIATMSIALAAGADGNALTAVGAADGNLDVSAAVTDSICATAIDASAKIIMCHFPH